MRRNTNNSNSNNNNSNKKRPGLSRWFNKKRSASDRSVNETATAVPPAHAFDALSSSARSVGDRSATARNSHSKAKLEKIMGGIKSIEKTHKELAKLPKVVTPWQNFVEVEYFIKFGGKWPDSFPERTPTPVAFQVEPRTPRGNPATWSGIPDAKVKDPSPCENPEEPPTKWHEVISEHDWEAVEAMLEKVSQKEAAPAEGQDTDATNENTVHTNQEKAPDGAGTDNDDLLAPLTQTDKSGYTPVHLACVEKMPSKLTQQLFQLNRDVALMKDNKGRLPLHLAALHNYKSAGVLDRLVRYNPDTIGMSDSFGRSPLRYAILQAEQRRDKSFIGIDWKYPVTQRQSQWQTTQAANWRNVALLLKFMIRRKKLLSNPNDQALVMESVQCFAPPDVVIFMLTVGFKVVANDTTSVILFSLLFRFNYPINVMEVALQMCLSTMSIPKLVSLFRQGLVRHFDEGCTEIYREMSQTKLAYRDELLEHGGVAALDDASKVWWDRLKFFLTVSTYQGVSYDEDLGIPQDQLVHSALSIPDVAPSLVDFLLRLTPDCGLQPDIKSGALPIHLACKNTKHTSIGKRMQIFKCALEGNPSLRRKEYRGRLPLHLALLAQQPLPVLQAILALDTQTAGKRDPMTRLFPFQLAVLSHPSNGSGDEKEAKEEAKDSNPSGDVVWSKLDASFELLRACPISILPPMYMGSGNLQGDINPITVHVVNWCYEYSKGREWVACEYRIQQLKELLASKDTKIADEDLEHRWTKAKQLIWQLYKIRSAKQKNKLKLGDDRFLLHAALMNGSTPPLLIAIILQQQAASVNKALSGNTWYPVHLAARSPSYSPLPFETSCIALPATTSLGLVANATKPENLKTLSGGKTPLELALTTGKLWDDIQELVKLHPESLMNPDSKIGQYPFQLAASKETSPSAYKIVRSRSVLEKWNTDPSSGAENAAKLKGYAKAYRQEKLNTAFEVLRAKPTAVLAAARDIRITKEA